MNRLLNKIEQSEENNPQFVAALEEIAKLQYKLDNVLFLTGYTDGKDTNGHLSDADRLEIITTTCCN